jgi:hypothetical protein
MTGLPPALTPADSPAERLRRQRVAEATAHHAAHPQYLARICDCTDGWHGLDHRVVLTGTSDDIPDVHYVPGHWANWRLVEITDRVTTKMGVAFEAGDVVLARPTADAPRVNGAELPVTCYSFRNGIDTAVPGHKVRAPLTLADGQPVT